MSDRCKHNYSQGCTQCTSDAKDNRIAELEGALKHERRMVIGLASAFRAYQDGREALDNALAAIRDARELGASNTALREACTSMLELIDNAEWTQAQRLACIHGARAAIEKAVLK